MKNKLVFSMCKLKMFIVLVSLGNYVHAQNNCNASLSLDGVNDYGQISNAFFSNVNQRNFTIEFYLKPNQTQSQYVGVWGKTGFWNEINVELYVPGKVRFFYATNVNGNQYFISDTAYWSANKWDHFAIVGDGSNNQLRIYKNGVLKGTTSHGTPNWSIPNNDSRLGAVFQGWVSPGTQFLNGKIDDFRVSDIVRYTSNFTPPQNLRTDNNTRVLYNFNYLNNGVVPDLSGNNNNLTLYNGAKLDLNDVPYNYYSSNVSIGRDTSLCKLDSFKLTASTGFKSYLWSTNDTSRSVFIKSSQKISVIATDSLGCKAYDTATISILNPKIGPRDTIVCKGSQATLSNTKNTSSSTCGYLPSALKSGLVAWYPFCGNANDESGNGNHGTVQGGATFTNDRIGKTSSAIAGNGSSSIEIPTPNSLPLGTNSRSISLHFKIENLSTLTSNRQLFAYGFNSTGQRFGLMLVNNQIGFEYSIASNFATWTPDLNWHHLVATFDKNTNNIKLYLDNNLIINTNPSTTINTTSCCSFIGSLFGPLNSYVYSFIGKIDDVGAWNRVLSAAEVSQLYTLQSSSPLSTKLTWSTSDSTSTTKITANANTQVWLKATDGIGTCYDTTNVYIRQPSVSIGADTIRVCKADSVQLSATKGFKSYLWNNGAKSDSIFVKSSEKITITAIDSIGCLAHDTSVVSLLNPKISPRDTVVCKSTQVTLRGSINNAVSTNTTCGYIPSALKSGLVAWYPFCGNANDESGNGNHGTVNGANLSNDRSFNSNSSIYHSSNNSYIKTKSVINNIANTFSISLWVNPAQADIIKTQGVTGLEGYGTMSVIHPPHGSNWGSSSANAGVGINVGNNQVQIVEHTHLFIASPLVYQANISGWHHIVLIYNNHIPKLYLDGNLVATGLQSTIQNVRPGSGYCSTYPQSGFGNSFYPNGTPIGNYKGNYDDIGIWNRALSAVEVSELYKLQSVSYPPKLSWSTSDTTSTTKITPLATTKLWLKASNGIGTCYDTTSVIVSKPVINLQDTTLLTNCKRDSLQLNIGSKWKFINWSNGSKDSITWLKTSGKYFVSAKDQYGCAAADSTNFVNPGNPKIKLIVSDSVNCFGGKDGSLNASAAGGFAPVRYLWNDAAKQITSKASGLSKGSYKLIFSDAYNCKDSMSAIVSEPAKLLLSLVTSDSVNCFGGSDGSLKVSTSGGSGGNSYQWNDPNTQKTALAVNLKAGIYKVNVSDIYGCSDTLTASVYQPKKVVAGISTFKNAKCFGYSDGSALGNGSGGTGALKYSWNTSPVQNIAQAVNLSKGKYLLTVTDGYGCFDTVSSIISEPAKIVSLISANRLAVRDIPHELSSFVTPTQTYTYQWTPSSVFGKNTNKPVINGKFQTITLVTLRTTDNNGCFGEDTATITVLIPFGDFIPTVFSPNADKHNDVFGLPDIFEIEQLDVYNRWGELLFSGSASNPSWDGLYKGEIVPQGTYIYMIKANLKGTVYKFEHQGSISVVR